ncbi:hypothetical protein [Natronorubrum sp. FCH18a]|uniref:hypothetical protein n=1 Tax=Natronorubrum sp. FCH18a TaxID=3447018 RepID=UPI003F50E9FA
MESVLAAVVLLIGLITVADLPRPYPSWPTIGAVPVDPELVIPALLSLAVLIGVIVDGLSVGSVVSGLLGVITLWIALMSLHTLYTVETGGVFWGGFFTLISGVTLAIVVLIRAALRQTSSGGVPRRLRSRFGN